MCQIDRVKKITLKINKTFSFFLTNQQKMPVVYLWTKPDIYVNTRQLYPDDL